MALTVRTATTDDLEQVIALQVDRNGADVEPMVRALWADDEVGPGHFTVADDDGVVVSSLCLMTETMRMGTVTIPTGQIEFVATTADHEHRGLVRQQMDLVHALSHARGDLVQVIGGISYFYRRFGYEYAVGFPRVRLLSPGLTIDPPAGWTVRRATVDDVDDVVRLQDEVQARVPLVAMRSRKWWEWECNQADTDWRVAVRDGVVHGAAEVGDGPPFYGELTQLRKLAADHGDAVWVLLVDAAIREKPVAFEERPTLSTIAHGVTHRHPRTYGLYVRVADVRALIDHLRPVLTERLAGSPRAGTTGELLLSLYTSSLTIRYERGEVVGVDAGPPMQDPFTPGGAGVPPDLVATLLFGRYGASGLADRHDDVNLGRVADLMDMFFPALDADLIFTF